jgi:ketosteroid isomerase-like protein
MPRSAVHSSCNGGAPNLPEWSAVTRDTARAMSQENVEVVRRTYEAFNLRDLDALAELTEPDWVMDWSRSIGPQRGVYRGRTGVEAWIAAISEAFESFEILPLEYVGAGDRIVVPARVKGRGRSSGVVVDAEGVTLWKLERGRVASLTLYETRREALEAAGLSE